MAGNKYSKKAFIILCAAIVVFTLAGCKKETPAPDSEDETAASPSEDPVVEPSEELVIELGVGVGPVRLGMSKEELIENFGEPDKFTANGQGLDYKSSRGLLFGVNPTAGINLIKCYSKEYPTSSHVTTFRTTKGVAMGASRNQITAVYGEPDRTASKDPFTILYYDNLRSEMIITNDRLVGIKMVNQL